MRVKCANCGTIYDILPSPCDYSNPYERKAGHCPSCKSNAYDETDSSQQNRQWKKEK